ncbi:hypothetical protein PAXRUDRAFT_171551 [Paxillus rubicundulus Ve08.2h10]|uniref:Uncharacterized protein n=1 Tax=Paxillus rubicundulus Ve08.2h10 TaxID=930991 RepID=A0A0D0CXF3_9AGAM|nr:hypothetical protein PAXRUDRAFT_171551 [Paxillus rubicundulus Ve08.2h10]
MGHHISKKSRVNDITHTLKAIEDEVYLVFQSPVARLPKNQHWLQPDLSCQLLQIWVVSVSVSVFFLDLLQLVFCKTIEIKIIVCLCTTPYKIYTTFMDVDPQGDPWLVGYVYSGDKVYYNSQVRECG